MSVPLAGVSSQKPNTLSLLQDFSSSAPIGVPIMPAGRAAEEFVELSGLEPKISEPKSDVLPLHHSSIKTGDSDAADFTIDDTLENSHE